MSFRLAVVALLVCIVGVVDSFRLAPLRSRQPRARTTTTPTALQAAMIFQFEYEHREQGHTQLLDLVDGMRADQDAFIVYYAQWCPDCAAVPGILQGLENAGVGTVIMCNIGAESKLWKSGEHYYKQPPLSLRGIPTVVRWGAEGEVERMERGLMDGTMMRQGASRSSCDYSSRPPTNPSLLLARRGGAGDRHGREVRRRQVKCKRSQVT